MVHVAGFGLSIDDLKWIMLLLFVAITLVQFELNLGMGFIPLLDKKVMGYPICESVFCFAPSLADLQSAAQGFYTLTQPKGFVDILDLTNPSKSFVGALVTTFVSSIWVLVKLLISVMIFWIPIKGVMTWYGFWMPHAIN